MVPGGCHRECVRTGDYHILFLRDWHGRTRKETIWGLHLSKVLTANCYMDLASDVARWDTQPPEILARNAVVFLHPYDSKVQEEWINWFSNEEKSCPKGHLIIVSTNGRVVRQVGWNSRIHAC